jgi:Na+/H+-dicarboxylate symporters
MKKKKISMTIQIMIAMILGIAIGILFGEKISGIKLLGDIFLRLIQMSVVVMIMGSIIESIASLDSKELGKLGLKMLFWFSLTTLLGAAIGYLVGDIFNPGRGLALEAAAANIAVADTTIAQMFLDFFPTNIVKSMAEGNVIQVIIFACLFGIALGAIKLKKGASIILDGVKEFNEIVIGVIGYAMKFAPIGIAALLAYTTGTIGIKVIIPLLKFLLVLGGSSFAYLMALMIFAAFYCKTSPINVAKKFMNMTIMALTTTSSAVTLPTQMEDSETKLGVSKKISRLVNPLGMTLNSAGLSLYLSLACITLAQVYGIDLGRGGLIRVVVLCTLACLGTVSVPGGGLVALTMVIPSLGLPIEGIALISGIDWFSGMFRTALNVDGDALIALIIAKSENEIDYAVLNGDSVK